MRYGRAIVVATLVATGVGGCMSYIAGEHNSQCEFCNSAGELSAWMLFTHIFVWYFALVFIIVLVPCVAIFHVHRGDGRPT